MSLILHASKKKIPGSGKVGATLLMSQWRRTMVFGAFPALRAQAKHWPRITVRRVGPIEGFLCSNGFASQGECQDSCGLCDGSESCGPTNGSIVGGSGRHRECQCRQTSYLEVQKEHENGMEQRGGNKRGLYWLDAPPIHTLSKGRPPHAVVDKVLNNFKPSA